jgi:hypothetical protein
MYTIQDLKKKRIFISPGLDFTSFPNRGVLSAAPVAFLTLLGHHLL